MSHEKVDTRVTAYVFGELSTKAAAEFERELEQSSQLQEEVAAIREAVGALKSEFSSHASEVDAAQREVIEQAIRDRSESGATVALAPSRSDRQDDAGTGRRALAIAAIAASALIVVTLAYSRVIGHLTAVTMNESGEADVAGVGETTIGKVRELSALVDSFNELISQQRYDEADIVAAEVNELAPDNPIGATMLSAARMGRQINNDEAPLGNAQADTAEMAATESGPSAPPAVVQKTEDSQQQRQAPSEPFAGQPQPTSSDAIAAQAESVNRPSPADAAGGLALREDATEESELVPEFSIAENDDTGLLSPSARQPLGQTENKLQAEAAGEQNSPMLGMGMGGMGGGGFGLGSKAMDMERMVQDGRLGDSDLAIADLHGGDRFEPIDENPFVDARRSPLSTFSIDVDTASYAKVRALLNRDTLPRANAVRIEEMLNYFNYDYGKPEEEHPFAASMEVAACPWNQKHRLARIGIQGKVIEQARPSSNLVFLLDVSGSMDEANKLPLMIDGMKMLTDQLNENDKVSIVVYAGAAGLVLDATRGDEKPKIVESLDRLRAGGSTNGGRGIVLAYQLARDNFIVGGTNRVILCTDGDFNVGVTGDDELVKIAQKNAKSDIFLSVLGFGIGNHNDAMMEQISNKGNGNYAFIDNRSEAKKVLIEELGSTLVTIAKDVKIQIEFNPKHVASYRLIGYENRVLAAEDFNNDKKDAGEIGAGHTVTALYEIVPAGIDDVEVPPVDALRYQIRSRLSEKADSGESLVLKLRYKLPESDKSTLIEITVKDSGKRFSQTDRDFKFAASVAAFGMLLRDSPHKGDATFASVTRLARQGAKGDDHGYRTEFVRLVAKASKLVELGVTH